MKIPMIVMAGLLAVGVSAQTTKPVKKINKPVKKIKKADASKPVKAAEPKVIVKKDTLLKRGGYCPACGMG